MVNTGLGWKKFPFPPGQFLLISTLFFVPALSPPLFGWLNGLLAVPVFYLLTVNGYNAGKTQIGLSLVLAGVGALLVQRVEVFLFSLTLVPLGYALFRSAHSGESAAVSGGRGILALGLTWLVFWGGYGVAAGTNPYSYLLQTLDLGFDQTLKLYSSKEADLSPEMVYNLQLVTSSLRETIPKMLPGILASMVLLTVWVTMAAGNSLVGRFGKGRRAPWGPYATWKLPEQLVWLPIAAVAVMLLSTGRLHHASGWLLLISGWLYFFQGLAVLIALFERWRVPVLVRIMLYFVLFIQSYSLILLAVLGLSDVWLNMRRQSEK